MSFFSGCCSSLEQQQRAEFTCLRVGVGLLQCVHALSELLKNTVSQLFWYKIDAECLFSDTLLLFTGGGEKGRLLSYSDFEDIVSSGWRGWLLRVQEVDFYLPYLVTSPDKPV